MRIELSCAEARRRYPVQVAEVMAKIRSSKSKYKNLRPEDFSWAIDWSLSCRAHSFAEVLNMAQHPETHPKLPQTEDEAVIDYKNRAKICLMVWKRTMHEYSGELPDMPQEIEQNVRDGFRKDKVERERVESLTPAQKQQEERELIKQLSGMGGFSMVVGIPRK